MISEREILISILNLTRDGSADVKEIIREVRIPSEVVCQVLDRNVQSGLIHLSGSRISVTSEQRLRIAIKALDLGADIERICKYLGWEEFEDISTLAFEVNGFVVKKHFRFSCDERRYEIDLLALKRPFVICADCKQWRRGWMGLPSRKAAEKQVQRTKSLAENSLGMLKKIGIEKWSSACFIPLIISLFPSESAFCKNVPIVPIIQLRSFIQDMLAYVDEFEHYWISIR